VKFSKKLPKVNARPLGENSPNPVTLLVAAPAVNTGFPSRGIASHSRVARWYIFKQKS
jgi:hypothetical protein